MNHLVKTRKIAYLGPPDTFSHIAAEKNAQFLSMSDIEFIALDKMEDVVEYVQDGRAEFGLAPYWNTSKHRIVTAQAALIQNENVAVVDNFKMDINLYLVSQAESLAAVQSIHTVTHVIKQYSIFHSEKLQHILHREVESTMQGVQEALQNPKTAAVCSLRAAKKASPRLNVLAENIQNPKNATLFFMFTRTPSFDREATQYYTLFAYPLVKQFKTSVEVVDLLLEKLIYKTNDWGVEVDGRKWAFIEVSGHINDIAIRELFDELSSRLPGTRRVGCYTTRIEQLWDDSSRFDSY